MKGSREARMRSVTKATLYRIVSIFVDSVVAYFFTRNVGVTVTIVAIVNGYSTVLYYLHERLWAHIAWGRKDTKK